MATLKQCAFILALLKDLSVEETSNLIKDLLVNTAEKGVIENGI